MNPATDQIGKKVLRKQYINNLNLEAKNNHKNYLANKIFEITGEEPIQPPDTSSIEDKYKNVLNLQTLVRSQLMELTDGGNANQIVDNLSVDMLQFVAQRMPSLIEDLKPKYALGIPSQVFLKYVDKLKKKAEATLDIEYGSSGQTPFSSAITSPVFEFGDIYQQPALDETPSTVSRNLISEFDDDDNSDYQDAVEDKGALLLVKYKTLGAIKKELKDKGYKAIKDKDGNSVKVDSLSLNGKTPNKQLRNTNAYELLKGIAIRGRGLNKAKAPRIRVDTSTGIMKQKRYIPFGRYVINRHQLNNKDIVMIRTMKGGAIIDLPSSKVSSHLSSLLQKLLAGKSPSFDDINDLPMQDKHSLHHIIKRCDIDVSVPTPNKDKEKQDMNRFDILKGEILAGNDNKEMVKEFKVMLLRFMNNGRIPRRQGQEILTDLISMGY